MPNINAVVNEQIRRLARREITANTKVVKRATAHYRRDIAALKRQMATLTKTVKDLQKHEKKMPGKPLPEPAEGLRFRAIGVKAHRTKLGLSADLYGKLVGVSGLTIYNWENGKAKPRNKATVAKWLGVRTLGKREAMERLGLAESNAAPPAKPAPRKTGKRGTFKQTAAEMILSLLKGRKVLTTKQLAEVWNKSGRAGSVDNSLSLMMKGGKLKRKPLGGKSGSEYRAA